VEDHIERGVRSSLSADILSSEIVDWRRNSQNRRWIAARGLALHLAQADPGASTIFCDKLNPSLFEGAPHIFKRTWIWLPRSAFKVRDRLRGCFACR